MTIGPVATEAFAAEGVRVAVLMACHNRKALTLRCLQSLRGQPLFRAEHLFLVDDGSTDGTGDAVRAAYPQAQVIQGSGDLFWNGGMRLAWETARAAAQPFDYYLWLNDDVVLRPDALASLLADARAAGPEGAVIVTGSTVEPGTETLSYGGHVQPSPSHPLRLKLMAPTGRPEPVFTVSGNIVLISRAAEERLGNLSPAFEHIFGDLDYGFRAKRAGVPVFLASAVLGECGGNPTTGGSLDGSLGRIARLRARWREERRVHARDWRRFARMHSGLGPLSVLYSAAPYLRILLNKPN